MMILHCLLNNSEEPSRIKKMMASGMANLQLNVRIGIQRRTSKGIQEKVTRVC